MKTAERRNKILNYLRIHDSATVAELGNFFNASEETIRRDLSAMEGSAALTRIHGGAIYNGYRTVSSTSFSLRKEACRDAKTKIAMLCKAEIKEKDSIFLDASTTALFLAEELAGFPEITVITNGLCNVYALSGSKKVHVISTGGELNGQQMAYFGSCAERALDVFHVDKAFVPCSALSKETGSTDGEINEGRLRALMMKNAGFVYLMADSTKLNKNRLSRIADLDSVDAIVCDSISSDWTDEFERRNIRVIS